MNQAKPYRERTPEERAMVRHDKERKRRIDAIKNIAGTALVALGVAGGIAAHNVHNSEDQPATPATHTLSDYIEAGDSCHIANIKPGDNLISLTQEAADIKGYNLSGHEATTALFDGFVAEGLDGSNGPIQVGELVGVCLKINDDGTIESAGVGHADELAETPQMPHTN